MREGEDEGFSQWGLEPVTQGTSRLRLDQDHSVCPLLALIKGSGTGHSVSKNICGEFTITQDIWINITDCFGLRY